MVLFSQGTVLSQLPLLREYETSLGLTLNWHQSALDAGAGHKRSAQFTATVMTPKLRLNTSPAETVCLEFERAVRNFGFS